MLPTSVIITLPIADRRRSLDFYTAAFGFGAVGPLADDGVPEPLQLELGGTTRLMLIPTGGFSWGLDGNEVAGDGISECVIDVGVATNVEVDALVDRVADAGGVVRVPPATQPWGHSATVADPDGHLWTITCPPDS